MWFGLLVGFSLFFLGFCGFFFLFLLSFELFDKEVETSTFFFNVNPN